jgi:hypothetical protein
MTRRGIREMKHKRILFGDLGYNPSQSPYKPEGIRKMENVWRSWEDGLQYITMVPGYTSLGTVANSARVKALGHAKGNYRGTYFYTDDDLLYEIDGDGSFTSIDLSAVTWSDTFVNTGRMSVVGYGNHTYLFSGVSSGSADNITFNASNPASTNEYGTAGAVAIGFDRPNITTGDDTGAAASSALGAGSGTAVKGVVKYFVSYTGQDGNDEGALSLEFGEIDAGDGDDVDLSNLPTSGTNKRRLYRTFKDGDQPFYLATLNSSDTTYTDNIADVDLGDLPLQHGDPPPQNVKSSLVHYGRVYALATENENTGIYWCDPDGPSSWYTSDFGNWLNIPGLGFPSALGRTPDGIIAFFQNNTMMIQGRSPSEFTLREITALGGDNIGIGVTPADRDRAITHSAYGTFFFHRASKSIYMISSGGMRKISDPIDADLYAIEHRSGNTTFSGICLQWIPHLNLLAASFGAYSQSSTGLTNENKTWFYEPKSDSWVGRADYGFFALSSWVKSSSGTSQWSPNYSYVGFGENGNADKVYQILTGTNHNGSAIVPVLGAPTFVGDDPTVEKTFHYVDILSKPVAGETLKVEWFVDGATSADGSATITMTGTDSRERHRVYINERGRELDIDITLDDASGNSGVYGTVYGYTDDTSVVGS